MLAVVDQQRDLGVQVTPSFRRSATVDDRVRKAWSEIDHKIRYPYDTQNDMLGEYLAIFNRIVGSADEMGSFIKKLKEELRNQNSLIKTKRSTKNINEVE